MEDAIKTCVANKYGNFKIRQKCDWADLWISLTLTGLEFSKELVECVTFWTLQRLKSELPKYKFPLKHQVQRLLQKTRLFNGQSQYTVSQSPPQKSYYCKIKLQHKNYMK